MVRMTDDHDGLYVAVEGIDGSGTTSVAQRLGDGDDVVTTEPYDEIWTGGAVREALGRETAAPTDLFLFLADRAEHLERVVRPALREGRTVVSDRSKWSTYAYQPRNVADLVPDPWAWFDGMYAPWDVGPDVTILLEIDPDEAAARTADEGEKYEVPAVQRHAANNYESLAGAHGFERIDATMPLDDVVAEARRIVGAASRGAL